VPVLVLAGAVGVCSGAVLVPGGGRGGRSGGQAHFESSRLRCPGRWVGCTRANQGARDGHRRHSARALDLPRHPMGHRANEVAQGPSIVLGGLGEASRAPVERHVEVGWQHATPKRPQSRRRSSAEASPGPPTQHGRRMRVYVVHGGGNDRLAIEKETMKGHVQSVIRRHGQEHDVDSVPSAVG